MRTAGCIVGFAVMAALAGCSHQSSQSAQYAPTGDRAAYGTSGRTAQSVETCPMAQLRDIQAFVSEMNDGVAITFTAPYAEVDQLRQNVRAMADANDMMGNAFAACPCGQGLGTGVAERMPGDVNGSGSFGETGSTANPSTNGSGQGLSNGSYGASQAGAGTTPDQSRTSGTYGAGQYTSPTTSTSGPMGGAAPIAIPPSKATIDEIPSGAVLELRAKDPSQILTLRTAAKDHVHALRFGCLGQPSPR